MSEFLGALPSPVVTALYFVIALFPLVLVHEIGHFVIAKLNHVRVDEFGIGFPPRIARLATIGETEYTLNVLPLGGFVRLSGEDDPTVPGSFAGRGKRVRAAVLLAGPFFNFAFAAVVFCGIALAGQIPLLVPGIDGVKVMRVTAGSPAERAGLLPGDFIVATDGQSLVAADSTAATSARPDEAMTELTRRADAASGVPLALLVLRGPMVLLSADAVPAGVTTSAADLPGVVAKRVTTAPAGAAVAAGDVLLPVDDADAGLGASGSRAAVAVLRQPEVVTLSVVPVRAAPGEPGRMGIQITAPSVPARFGPVAAAWHGVRMTGRVVHAMVTALARMLVGQAAVEIKGPVGISIMSREIGEQGWNALLEFMALLSINLGVINLFPLPALDGGRLLFIAAEAVRGRRMEPSREAIVHLVGFVLVIGLMAAITMLEVARLTGWVAP